MPRRKAAEREVEYVPIEGHIIHDTIKAVLLERGDAQHWIPRSQCEGGDNIEVNDTDIRVSKWFAEKEGLV